MKLQILIVAAMVATGSCSAQETQDEPTNTKQTVEIFDSKEDKVITVNKVEKTDAEWKAELTDFEYKVLREKGTERAFTGEYYHNKEKGTYNCKGCGTELYSSETKYDSGSGWPSFYDVIDEKNVKVTQDNSLGMTRLELTCARCGSHLGHVFDDGPNPTGLRYCVNSVSLDFQKADDKDSDTD